MSDQTSSQLNKDRLSKDGLSKDGLVSDLMMAKDTGMRNKNGDIIYVITRIAKDKTMKYSYYTVKDGPRKNYVSKARMEKLLGVKQDKASFLDESLLNKTAELKI